MKKQDEKEIKEWYATGMQPLRHYINVIKNLENWSYQEGIAHIIRRLDGIDFKLEKLIEKNSK